MNFFGLVTCLEKKSSSKSNKKKTEKQKNWKWIYQPELVQRIISNGSNKLESNPFGTNNEFDPKPLKKQTFENNGWPNVSKCWMLCILQSLLLARSRSLSLSVFFVFLRLAPVQTLHRLTYCANVCILWNVCLMSLITWYRFNLHMKQQTHQLYKGLKGKYKIKHQPCSVWKMTTATHKMSLDVLFI